MNPKQKIKRQQLIQKKRLLNIVLKCNKFNDRNAREFTEFNEQFVGQKIYNAQFDKVSLQLKELDTTEGHLLPVIYDYKEDEIRELE